LDGDAAAALADDSLGCEVGKGFAGRFPGCAEESSDLFVGEPDCFALPKPATGRRGIEAYQDGGGTGSQRTQCQVREPFL
jgi:hypothetical protein